MILFLRITCISLLIERGWIFFGSVRVRELLVVKLFLQEIFFKVTTSPTAWNELCRGPEIIWYGPVFFENTNIPWGTAIKTRDVYVGWPDPYLFRFGLFPRHGKSDFRTRHWYAAYQGHDIYLFSQICRKYRCATYASCSSTNAFNATWSLIEPNLHDSTFYG